VLIQLYILSVGPEWAAVNMAITVCKNCAGRFSLISSFYVTLCLLRYSIALNGSTVYVKRWP